MRNFLPTRKEWPILLDNLTRKEKNVLLSLFALALVSGTAALVVIDRAYSTAVPAYGGTLTEGMVGTPRFINPLLALSDVDRDLVRIIYAGLMKPSPNGELVPQLAERYEVLENGLLYTFYLKENLTWHDGEELTADDVAFTIKLAQNPLLRSPKFANWEGVTVEVAGPLEIRFRLKRPYAPFLGNATLGIMPKHIWENISQDEFPSSNYNIEPVGSGPFFVDEIARSQAGAITSYLLKRFSKYRPQKAYLKSLAVKFFGSEKELAGAIENGLVETAGVERAETIHADRILELNVPRVFGVFFNQDAYEALRDKALREALTKATDRDRIIKEARGGYARATSLPIPPGSFAHASTLEDVVYDPEGARAILEKAGYKDSDGDGIIEKIKGKEKTKISFALSTVQAPELVKVGELLKSMWREVGVEVDLRIFEKGDFEQDILRPRAYDALLYGLVLGYDADPFGFWHASQIRHPGSNVARYASTRVDKLLEDAHTATDRDKREELYKFFQEEISKDKPAVFLYSPSFLYVVPKRLGGINTQFIASPQERFSSIASWYVDTKSVWNILLR
ncbi:MAG: hypothetical protein HY470_01670 [Candidatus Ryanbacteria bacterium]|nr:hypothetical protein [Candidatus Ryanbacteria bacterium]